jgi:hypothetical protein
MTAPARPRGRTRALTARPTPRILAVVAGLLSVATAVCAGALIGGQVDLGPASTGRLMGRSAASAGWAMILVVVLPLVVAAAAGWRGSPRTGDLAALAGATVIGAGLLQLHVLRTFTWLQPAAIVCGIALVVLGLAIRVPRADRRPGDGGVPRDQRAERPAP